MTLRKRVLYFATCFTVLALSCAGCANSPQTPQQNTRPGVAPNEVVSLTPLPEDKMILSIRFADGMDVERIASAIEAQFPEVELLMFRNTSMGLDAEGGAMQDILLSGARPNEFRNPQPGTFIDLSAQDFTANYNVSILNSCAIDGKLYYLPGPSTATGIVYDKELFAQNGWELPTSQDEFIELCKTIDATGIRAIQPTIQYVAAARLLFAGFTYRDSFAGVDNYQWLEKFGTGEMDMTGHMEPAMETMQRLLDAGIWRPSDFEVSPKDRSRMLYRDHSTAMITETLMAPSYAKIFGEGAERELGIMPFYSGNEPDSDYLIADPNFLIGLNADLEKKGNEDRLKMAMDILAYISSPEGQQAIISEETPLISNVIGTPLRESEFLDDIQETIDEGRLVYTPYYYGGISSNIDTVFHEKLRAFGEGKAGTAEVLAACDAARDELLSGIGKGELLGKAEKDFTVLEMSLYLADAFRESANAQIGLCIANKRIPGCNTKLYAGDIYVGTDGTSFGEMLGVNFTPGENGQTLSRVSMTGQALLDVLERLTGASSEYPNTYVTASGLHIEFAPWADTGKHFVSVQLADGTEVKPDQIYTVAVWQGTLDDTDITSVEETYSDSIVEIFKQRVQKDGGTIRPFDDQRFVLNWDIME